MPNSYFDDADAPRSSSPLPSDSILSSSDTFLPLSTATTTATAKDKSDFALSAPSVCGVRVRPLRPPPVRLWPSSLAPPHPLGRGRSRGLALS